MKTILQSLTLALAISVSPLAAAADNNAVPAASSVPRQAPGYYKWTLGNFAVTSLSDGTADMPVEQMLHGPKPGEVAASFKTAFARLPMEMSVNAFLIDTGQQLILVDTGGGTFYGSSLGRVRENLIAAGYRPEQVGLVLLTHIHGDHSGGLVIDGKPAFPNATIRASKQDLDYFGDAKRQKAATGLEKINFSAAEAVMATYRDGGKFVPIAGQSEIATGVRAISAPGHSPGHMVYIVESKGEKLLLLGDLVHVPQLQFAHPDYTMAFDFDEGEGRTVRKAFLQDAAAQRQWIAGAHLPFPGIGHIRTEGTGYAYVPAEYSANR
ncbi:MBL fold metallo-hydrolase [Agrobacterium deltaense]